jgi:pimeloyl-ACP methyl ester carboxylesterase
MARSSIARLAGLVALLGGLLTLALPGAALAGTGPHKVVVLFQGIDSSLSCDQNGVCTPGDPTAYSVRGLTNLANTLISQYGFNSSDILWYSYRGGTVDSGVPSGYLTNSHGCSDTSNRYDTDIKYLLDLVEGLGAARPDTQFYLVGHSQGGLVAFQGLGYLASLPQNGTSVGAIFTLDGPLGGSPEDNVVWARTFTCWGDPAASELIAMYGSTSSHATQGDSAKPACAFGFGPDAPVCTGFATNDDLVAARGATKAYTLGNTNDPVYLPRLCVPFTGSNDISSQIVNAADSGAAGLRTLPFIDTGLNVVACVDKNHGLIALASASGIAAKIGPQN